MSWGWGLGCCCEEATYPYYDNRVVLGPVICASAECGSCVDAGDGSFPWTNPGNIVGAQDNVYATVTPPNGSAPAGTTWMNRLICTDYGFSIPAGAQNINVFSSAPGSLLNGVALQSHILKTYPGTSTIWQANITKDGSSPGVGSGSHTPGSFGAGSILLVNNIAAGVPLSAADVNASTFGVVFRISPALVSVIIGTGQIEVDNVKLNICYQLPL